MAYMSQDKKAKIAAALKAVMPSGWKWSLRVHHHSTLVMTIASAPVDLFAHMNAVRAKSLPPPDGLIGANGHADVNHRYLDRVFEGDLLTLFERISEALNLDNHDRSDIMTDYFDVGHYVDLNLGRWDKPFMVRAA